MRSVSSRLSQIPHVASHRSLIGTPAPTIHWLNTYARLAVNPSHESASNAGCANVVHSKSTPKKCCSLIKATVVPQSSSTPSRYEQKPQVLSHMCRKRQSGQKYVSQSLMGVPSALSAPAIAAEQLTPAPAAISASWSTHVDESSWKPVSAQLYRTFPSSSVVGDTLTFHWKLSSRPPLLYELPPSKTSGSQCPTTFGTSTTATAVSAAADFCSMMLPDAASEFSFAAKIAFALSVRFWPGTSIPLA